MTAAVSVAQVGKAARLPIVYTPANRSLGTQGIALLGRVVRADTIGPGTLFALQLPGGRQR